MSVSIVETHPWHWNQAGRLQTSEFLHMPPPSQFVNLTQNHKVCLRMLDPHIPEVIDVLLRLPALIPKCIEAKGAARLWRMRDTETRSRDVFFDETQVSVKLHGSAIAPRDTTPPP